MARLMDRGSHDPVAPRDWGARTHLPGTFGGPFSPGGGTIFGTGGR
jgi:hypothetical protein